MPVETTQVNPEALRAALKATGGDASRLRIIDERTIEIREPRNKHSWPR